MSTMTGHKDVPLRNYERIEVEPSSEAVSRSSPVDFLKISLLSVGDVHGLLRSQKEILNEVQCWDLSTKLSRAALNIEHLVHFSERPREEFDLALKNFFRITENAKRLVESCCSESWCQAAALQINNEEAFREILIETGLCYDEIYDQGSAKSSFEIEDLRQSSAFSPATVTEVRKDQKKLYRRLKDLANTQPNYWSEWLIQNRRLALHLLERLHAILQHESGESSWGRSDLGIEHDDFPLDAWGEHHSIKGGAARSVFRTTWLGMPCAKKVFKLGEWNTAQFKTEASTLPTLNHPNIVKFFSCDQESQNNECYIAMELMEKNLEDVIHEQVESGRVGASFSLPVAVDILIQMANGMCYLHDHEYAHRDLKPANVLVSRYNSPYLRDYFHVKLADFGLLKTEVRTSGAVGSSKPGVRTTIYRAPEAFSQGGRKSKFALHGDVYSFAVTASHILTGRKPFQGIPASLLYEAVLDNERPRLPSSCPEELASIIRDCWVTEYRKRPTFVDICCRLEIVRNRLLRGVFYRSEVPQHDVPSSSFTEYVQWMCSERSAVRQRNAVVYEDKHLATRLDLHSTTSMPSRSADTSADPQFDSESRYRHKPTFSQIEEVDVATLVNELITKLSSRRTEVHRDAAKTIRCLAKLNQENRVLIAEQRGIPFLIDLLRSPDTRTQEHAITALMNLSLHVNNRGLIMRAGAIDAIVHVVKWGHTEEARENAAAAIQCLSYDNENKISIGNTGAIPALVELLCNGTRQGKKDAANALCNLVSFREGNKRRAVEAGVINALMDILHDCSTYELDDASLTVLANIAVYREGLCAIADTEPISMLIGYITSGSKKGKELATALLCKLCSEDHGFIDTAYHGGASSPLAALLRDNNATDRCKRKARELLSLLR